MLRTNVIYGLIVLVPAAIIFLLLTKIVEILEKMAVPLNFESTTSVVVAIVLGLLLWKRFIFPIIQIPCLLIQNCLKCTNYYDKLAC